ncbi:MAG: FliM/FliN family flagellar motor switch protein [Bacillota bacterium]
MSSSNLTQEEINRMLANLADGQEHQTVQKVRFMPLEPVPGGKPHMCSIDFLQKVPVLLTVELGKCILSVKEILDLKKGSVLQLNKLAGEPVEILINERLIASGEVLVINDVVGVRVNALLADDEKK